MTLVLCFDIFVLCLILLSRYSEIPELNRPYRHRFHPNCSRRQIRTFLGSTSCLASQYGSRNIRFPIPNLRLYEPATVFFRSFRSIVYPAWFAGSPAFLIPGFRLMPSTKYGFLQCTVSCTVSWVVYCPWIKQIPIYVLHYIHLFQFLILRAPTRSDYLSGRDFTRSINVYSCRSTYYDISKKYPICWCPEGDLTLQPHAWQAGVLPTRPPSRLFWSLKENIIVILTLLSVFDHFYLIGSHFIMRHW